MGADSVTEMSLATVNAWMNSAASSSVTDPPAAGGLEVMFTLNSGNAHGEEAIVATAELLNLADSQVRAVTT